MIEKSFFQVSRWRNRSQPYYYYYSEKACQRRNSKIEIWNSTFSTRILDPTCFAWGTRNLKKQNGSTLVRIRTYIHTYIHTYIRTHTRMYYRTTNPDPLLSTRAIATNIQRTCVLHNNRNDYHYSRSWLTILCYSPRPLSVFAHRTTTLIWPFMSTAQPNPRSRGNADRRLLRIWGNFRSTLHKKCGSEKGYTLSHVRSKIV